MDHSETKSQGTSPFHVTDPSQKNTKSAHQMKNVHSWRPPTPPPAPTSSEEEMNGARNTWNIKKLLRKDNHRHNKLDQNPSHDDDDSNIKFLSPETADIFDQEPIDSLILTEEGQDNNHTETSMANSLLNGNMKKNSTLLENLQRKQRQHTKTSHLKDDRLSSTYQMMKSQHGISSTMSSSLNEEQQDQQHDVSFFYSGMDDLEVSQYRQERNAPHWNHARNLQQESTNYFDHSLRRDFVEAHAYLNAVIKNNINDDDDHVDRQNEGTDDDYMDFSTLFSFGCSPSSRERHIDSEKDTRLPAIADITKSSLSYFHKGRVQMRLPTDHIRLAMDEYLDPGILIIERPMIQSEMDHKSSRSRTNDRRKAMLSDAQLPLLENTYDETIICDNIRSKNDPDRNVKQASLLEEDQDDLEQQILEPLNYILTVDQNIYKRLLADISSSRMPCGLYYCCHDTVDHSKNVHIGVAIAILSVVFTFIFVATCIWPLD